MLCDFLENRFRAGEVTNLPPPLNLMLIKFNKKCCNPCTLEVQCGHLVCLVDSIHYAKAAGRATSAQQISVKALLLYSISERQTCGCYSSWGHKRKHNSHEAQLPASA